MYAIDMYAYHSFYLNLANNSVVLSLVFYNQ